MKETAILRLAAGMLLAALVAGGGCARTPHARFYNLNPLADLGTERQVRGVDKAVALGLGPIRLPDYLDRPQIVNRLSPHQVRFAELHRWAEPLAGNFAGILAENLSILLATDRIALYPWKSGTLIDCQVEIDVFRFDGGLGNSVALHARWTLRGEDREKVLFAKTSNINEPVDGQDYEALVAAQSRALAGLSREIALAIEAARHP